MLVTIAVIPTEPTDLPSENLPGTTIATIDLDRQHDTTHPVHLTVATTDVTTDETADVTTETKMIAVPSAIAVELQLDTTTKHSLPQPKLSPPKHLSIKLLLNNTLPSLK